MREAESAKFSVGIPGEESGSPNRRLSKSTGFYRHESPNLEDIIKFIKNKNLSPESESFLINKAKKTPHGSLANFRKNYMIYLKNK